MVLAKDRQCPAVTGYRGERIRAGETVLYTNQRRHMLVATVATIRPREGHTEVVLIPVEDRRRRIVATAQDHRHITNLSNLSAFKRGH